MSLPKFLSAEGYQYIGGSVIVRKLHPNADMIAKENQSDIGWELTVIGRDENRVEDVFQDVNVFTTGLSLECPKGYHIEIVGHPALYKAGYTLMDGPRIINPEDRSEIKVPLYKFKEVEDLELPFRVALLVLRQSEYMLPYLEGGQSNTAQHVKNKGLRHEEDEPKASRRTGRRKGNMF
jgi:hypothetical protein